MKEKLKTTKTLQQCLLSLGLGIRVGRGFWWLAALFNMHGVHYTTDFLIWVWRSQGPQQRQHWGQTPSYYDERTRSSCSELITEHKYTKTCCWIVAEGSAHKSGFNFKDCWDAENMNETADRHHRLTCHTHTHMWYIWAVVSSTKGLHTASKCLVSLVSPDFLLILIKDDHFHLSFVCLIYCCWTSTVHLPAGSHLMAAINDDIHDLIMKLN